MLKPDFLVSSPQGYYCKYGDFYIDATLAVKHNLVSHAHADHARAGSQHVYCTEATADVMRLRYKNKAAKEFHCFEYKHSFSIQNVKITFYSAGHILGSAQILMEYEGCKYLYSGDIKLQDDASCVPLEFVQCDVLITETTFAMKDFQHPNVIESILKLDASHSPVLIGTYVLGKAQRLNHLISKYLRDTRIFIHYDIMPYHKLYEKHGFNIGHYEVLDRKMLKNKTLGIYLVPPLSYESYKLKYPYKFAFASGWKAKQENDLNLMISDHVDWVELLEYIERSNASEVWAIHGDSKDLIEHFKSSKVIVRDIYAERGN